MHCCESHFYSLSSFPSASKIINALRRTLSDNSSESSTGFSVFSAVGYKVYQALLYMQIQITRFITCKADMAGKRISDFACSDPLQKGDGCPCTYRDDLFIPDANSAVSPKVYNHIFTTHRGVIKKIARELQNYSRRLYQIALCS